MTDPTFAERARATCPGASDEDIEDLLWSATYFPFGNAEQILAQLRLSYTTHNGDVAAAIQDAHMEIEAAMDEYREAAKNGNLRRE